MTGELVKHHRFAVTVRSPSRVVIDVSFRVVQVLDYSLESSIVDAVSVDRRRLVRYTQSNHYAAEDSEDHCGGGTRIGRTSVDDHKVGSPAPLDRSRRILNELPFASMTCVDSPTSLATSALELTAMIFSPSTAIPLAHG